MLVGRPPQWLFTRVLPPIICPGAVYAVNTAEHLVALTIDDGPDGRVGPANSTAQILEVLQDHNQQTPEFPAHATFFLLGNQVQQRAAQSPDSLDAMTARIIQEGHEIGNHLATDSTTILLEERFPQVFTWTHKVLTPYAQLPGSRYPQVSWLRPGRGWCDRAMAETVSQQASYRSATGWPQIALGSIWPYDTAHPWPRLSQWFIRRTLQPGAIIILHDGGRRGDRTAQLLKRLLPELAREGYTLVPLSTLLERGEPVSVSSGLPRPLEAIRRFVVIRLERSRQSSSRSSFKDDVPYCINPARG